MNSVEKSAITKEMADICLAMYKNGGLWPAIKSHVNYAGTPCNLGYHIRKYERTGKLPKIAIEPVIPILRSDLKRYSEQGLTLSRVAKLHNCSESLVKMKCSEYCIKLSKPERKKPVKKPPINMELLTGLSLLYPPLSIDEIAKKINRSKSMTVELVQEIRRKDEEKSLLSMKRLALGFKDGAA